MESLATVARRVLAGIERRREEFEKVAAPDHESAESGAGSATREETPSMKVAVDGVATARGVSGEDQAAAMRRGISAQFVKFRIVGAVAHPLGTFAHAPCRVPGGF